jgi:hypothetical protein
MARKVEFYEGRLSALAVASLVMGIISLVLFPFLPLLRPTLLFLVMDVLLGIGAIVVGLLAMRRITIFPLRGRSLAYAGVVLGANGLFWLAVNFVFQAVR